MMMMMLIIIVTVTSIGAHGSYSCQTPPAGHHKNCMVLRSPYRAACVQLSMAPENGHQVSVYTSECSDGKSLPSPGSSIRLLLGTC
ncbi:uncharacterized protein LOC144037104 isoform X3 [Vanacampus margaritifer]